jgi:hypothetical protein
MTSRSALTLPVEADVIVHGRAPRRTTASYLQAPADSTKVCPRVDTHLGHQLRGWRSPARLLRIVASNATAQKNMHTGSTADQRAGLVQTY